MRLLTLPAGVTLSAALLAAPQTPPQAPPVFRGAIDLVQLDVSVLDKQRQPVHGLTAEDFTVVENGAPQQVVAVSEVTVERAPQPVWARGLESDVASNDVADKRILAIVIDRAGTAAVQVVRGVMQRMGPGDVVAVVGGGCFVPLTEDPGRLQDCLNSMRQDGPRPTPVAGRMSPPPPRAGTEPPRSLLRDVAAYLATASPRRKAILYVSDGIFFGPGGRRSDRADRASEDLRETLWYAHLANVNVYPVKATSVNRVTTPGRPAAFDSLRNLAGESGGVAFDNSAALDSSLDQVFVESSAGYLIGYRSTHPSMDGKFRELSVKVVRPGLLVRTRTKVYRAAGANGSSDPRAGSVSSRLRDWMPSLDVGFDVAVLPFAAPPSKDATVVVVAGVTQAVAPGMTTGLDRIDLRVLAYDDTGAVAKDVTRRVDLGAPADANTPGRRDVRQDLTLGPGRYHLRVTARDPDSGRLGSVEFDATVPDFQRQAISLSGVVLTAAAETPPIAGPLASIIPATPTALRRFLPGDHLTALARVYEAAAEPPASATLDVRILDASGTAVYAFSEPLPADRFSTTHSVGVRLDLPMDRLKAGQYLLTLQATRDARRTLPRDVRFVVR